MWNLKQILYLNIFQHNISSHLLSCMIFFQGRSIEGKRGSMSHLDIRRLNSIGSIPNMYWNVSFWAKWRFSLGRTYSLVGLIGLCHPWVGLTWKEVLDKALPTKNTLVSSYNLQSLSLCVNMRESRIHQQLDPFTLSLFQKRSYLPIN